MIELDPLTVWTIDIGVLLIITIVVIALTAREFEKRLNKIESVLLELADAIEFGEHHDMKNVIAQILEGGKK